jgi:hypothetical protein
MFSGSLTFIERTWKEQMRDVPFSHYFYDESLTAQYSAEQRGVHTKAYSAITLAGLAGGWYAACHIT